MCTNGYGAPGFYGLGPGTNEPAFPANGMFASTHTGWFLDGVPLETVMDPGASAMLGFEVFRPAQPLQAGDVLGYWDDYCEPACSYCPSTCDEYRATIAEPDLVAPAMPELTVHTLLVDHPAGAGALSCGDSDSLQITLSVSDDNAPTDELGLVAYIAPTTAEVGPLTVPSAVLGLDYSYGGLATSTITLGDAIGHMRTGDSPFVSKDPICFALAAFDRAGNLSERSYVSCVDTDDPDDPSVVWVASSGCGCHAGGGAGLGTALLVAAVAVVLRGTGRGRRPSSGRGSRAPLHPPA